MNFKKIIAGTAASVMAVSSLAAYVSASAIYVPEETPANGCSIDSNWLVRLYSEDETNPIDYGLDLTKLDKFDIYFEMVKSSDEVLGIDPEMYDYSIDGVFAGSFIYSQNGGPVIGSADKEGETTPYDDKETMYKHYNWPTLEWWAVPEEGDSAEGQEAGTNKGNVDYNKTLHVEYVNPFSYKLEYVVSADESRSDPRWRDDATLYQVGLQEWSSVVACQLKVNLMTIYDEDGNLAIAFDGLGNKLEKEDAEAKLAEITAPVASEPEEPAESTPAESEDSSEESKAPADDNSGDNTTTPDTTTAPNPNPTTPNMLPIIIAIVAVVVVVVIIVIVVVVKKKKNS